MTLPHCAVAAGPQMSSQDHKEQFGVEQGQDLQCLSCPTSTVIILTACTDRSERELPWLFLGLWKGYFILAWRNIFPVAQCHQHKDWMFIRGRSVSALQAEGARSIQNKGKSQLCLYYQEMRRQKRSPAFFTLPTAFLLDL